MTRRSAGIATRQLALDFEGFTLTPQEAPEPLDLIEALGTEVLSPTSITIPACECVVLKWEAGNRGGRTWYPSEAAALVFMATQPRKATFVLTAPSCPAQHDQACPSWVDPISPERHAADRARWSA